ncbi:MAG: PAS-domain containing protein [Alphaproteobacteria bacterium]|nr:PAS-domain containing protein [Alphaproteobacteria bacterium]
MEPYKNLIKNLALIVSIGSILTLCWGGGLFSVFSWASCFLVFSGIFCILWLKARGTAQTFKKLLLTRGESWALCEERQIIDRAPSFPVESLYYLKNFLHADSLAKVELAIDKLIRENLPFQIHVHAKESDTIYIFEGDFLDGKSVLWIKNITDTIHKERLYAETLQKNETLLANLQTTLDLLPILIWHRDEHQKINYCNSAYSIAVQSPSQKVYEEGIELIQSRFARILARKALNTGEQQNFESVAIADGDRRYFRICEIPNAKDQGTLGIAYDITELNDVRTEIKRLIHAHDEVLDHLSTAISIYDAEGMLHYYNQAYVNLHSFDEDFLKARPRLDEVLEELRSRRQLPEYADFPAYKKRRLQQLKEQVAPQEDLMHLPDERTLRIFSAPHPMGGLLFIFEDVTDYLALERKNKTLLDAYQATLDNLFEGVVVIGSDNRLRIFNPSFVRLWSFEGNDIKPGQHLTTIIEKLKDLFDYEENWEPYKAQLIENVTDRVPKTGQLKRKDGMIVNFRYLPLPNGDHLLSYTDATDTCRVQQALQERNEALETADRLKSEFIANVSYELRAPLNTIIGFTEILSHQYFGNLNERQIDYINGVLESSNKLLHLVNDILDLASIEAGYLTLLPQNVNIPTLLKEVAALIAKRAETNRQYIVLKCDKDVGDWFLDQRRLKQALFNLISNAIKFTPAEGKITLTAEIKEDMLEISVVDTGVGIAPEDQTRLFEKFERGKNIIHMGAGLGLSLVKNLIELHGGYIKLFSDLNKGTKVTCFIPKAPQQYDPAAGKSPPQSISQ